MKAEILADKAWREICDSYQHHTSDDYLALYEVFIDAFVKGFRAHRAVLQTAKGGKS
jgi:hypothetical protein